MIEFCSEKLDMTGMGVFLSMVVGMERKEDTRWECGVNWSVKGSLHVKHKFTLKCAIICPDIGKINKKNKKSIYFLPGANRT